MRKLIITALLVTGMASLAQEKTSETKKEGSTELTQAQKNELHLKKMTLDLSLDSGQQKEMAKIIADQGAKMEKAKAERKARAESTMKLTADEKFSIQSKRLDEQIAMKERVKKILNPEQFGKWEEMQEHRKREMMEGHKKRKGNQRDN